MFTQMDKSVWLDVSQRGEAGQFALSIKEISLSAR